MSSVASECELRDACRRKVSLEEGQEHVELVGRRGLGTRVLARGASRHVDEALYMLPDVGAGEEEVARVDGRPFLEDGLVRVQRGHVAQRVDEAARVDRDGDVICARRTFSDAATRGNKRQQDGPW